MNSLSYASKTDITTCAALTTSTDCIANIKCTWNLATYPTDNSLFPTLPVQDKSIITASSTFVAQYSALECHSKCHFSDACFGSAYQATTLTCQWADSSESSSTSKLASNTVWEFYSWFVDPVTTADTCVNLASYSLKGDIAACAAITSTSDCNSNAKCYWNYALPALA